MYRFRHWLGDRLFQVIFRLAELHEQKPRLPGWGADCDRQRDEATARYDERRREASAVAGGEEASKQ